MLYLIKLLCIFALVITSEASPRRYHHGTSRKLKAAASRLSLDVVPINYKVDLTLKEDFAVSKDFSGTVTIEFNINTNTKSFQIHMNKIEISDDVKLTGPNNEDLSVTINQPDPVTNLLTITSTQNFPPSGPDSHYVLTISYTGHLSDTDMMGLYLSSYKDDKGIDKYLVATQFENNGARRAFPCFDEPAIKATFDITVTYPDGYTALSNTKGGTPANVNGLKKVTFPQTPKMSTYVVAVIVSELSCTAGDPVNDIAIEVCSRKGTESTQTTALTTATEALQAMRDFTGIPFNNVIGKLSQAAIPDFSAGAMENWGMVNYKETYLLYDEDKWSNPHVQSVVTTITHELSHQWFGDMVTMNWWSDLFLNEGFATYFEYYATNDNHEEWKLPKQFVIEQRQPALLLDSKESSVPLHYEEADDTISGIYVDLSYSKGASVLTMVQDFLGLDNFKDAFTDYVSISIGTPELLWASFQRLPDDLPDSVALIMDNWINKPGYPLLIVTASGDNLVITQEAFLSGDTKWYVPITYTLSSKTADFRNTTTKAWLKPKENLTLKGVMKDQKWIVLNNQQAGFYRVNYDKNLWNKISTALNAKDFSNIDEISRSQIVDDLLNLARFGKKEYSDVLKMLSFMKNDDSYYVWYPAFNAFNYLLQRTVDTNVRTSLTKFITELMQTLYKSTPVTKVFHMEQIFALNQIQAYTWACKLNNKDCVDFAKQGFASYKKDPTIKPSSNMRGVVYCNGLRYSNDSQKDYDFLWNEYLASDYAYEKVTILKALGCSNDAAVRKQYLNTAFSNDVRIQDATYVFSSVYSNNPEGVNDVIEFIQTKYRYFVPRFGSYSQLSNLIVELSDYLTTQQQIDKLLAFTNVANVDDDTRDSIQIATVTATKNMEVTKDLEKKLKDYFNKSAPSSASMNSYHFVTAFVLLGYILCNFH